MKEFVEAVGKRLGAPATWPTPGKLILDGFKSHLHKPAREFLSQNNIRTIVLAPNLTHLIQLNDTGLLNGRVQQEIRQYKANLASINGGRDFPLERYVQDVERIIIGCFRVDVVIRAAKSIGFVYGPDATTVWMTQESISSALDAMGLQGKFREDPKVDDLCVQKLRTESYVQCLKAAELAGIRHSKQGISERQLIALEQFEDSLVQERKSSDRPQRKRRMVYRPEQQEKENQLSTTGNAINGSISRFTKQQRTSEEDVQRCARWKALQDEFPDLNLNPYKLHIRRYMNGMNNLQWAITHVNQARACCEGRKQQGSNSTEIVPSSASNNVYSELNTDIVRTDLNK